MDRRVMAVCDDTMASERWDRLTALMIRSWRRQLVERRETHEGSTPSQG